LTDLDSLESTHLHSVILDHSGNFKSSLIHLQGQRVLEG